MLQRHAPRLGHRPAGAVGTHAGSQHRQDEKSERPKGRDAQRAEFGYGQAAAPVAERTHGAATGAVAKREHFALHHPYHGTPGGSEDSGEGEGGGHRQEGLARERAGEDGRVAQGHAGSPPCEQAAAPSALHEP